MEKVTFTPVKWPNREAVNQFTKTPGVLCREVMCELDSGAAKLWLAKSPITLGWIVTRLEERELVVCAATGTGMGPAFREIKAGGLGDHYDSIRCHTSNWRVEAICQRVGLEFSEVIYHGGVNRGR
ncbi:hypothetical protein [Microbulbifer sp. VVAC002]|uniref:hypothetical protein n=1 Tax=Microbulbifer sp. VVAC002 TaxID=3243387 RepID=UPI00403945BB